MLIVAGLAFLIAVAVLIMMRDELSSGYARWQDYLVTTPLLFAAASGVFILESLLPTGSGIFALLLFFVRGFLAFALLVFVWGGTLTAAGLISGLVRTKR